MLRDNFLLIIITYSFNDNQNSYGISDYLCQLSVNYKTKGKFC